ncbi:MAG TPA: hypothetical protein VFX51_19775 [Solirubrobacteraceae bacterium]|nr:hypothetical protein [Solirubrobacteraceae bacterium]
MSKSVVLVAGSGRSGTSLFAGIMQRLGYTVPTPEVPADETNPRGFAESQWVVDFHSRLLKRAGVGVADARPSAWAVTARVCLDEAVTTELRGWLDAQLALADHLIVKDPRISWFAPLWRRCADELQAPPRFVTMLRHPAEVIDSKQRWYGGRQGEISRAAGWLNQTLFTERATRDAPRLFVRYDDLLADWTREVTRAGEALDLELVRCASPGAMRSVHEFVDRDLRRSRGGWDHLSLPEPLRVLADATWQEMTGERSFPELDALRASYTDLYAEAEAIAHSSIAAAGKAHPGTNGRVPPAAAWLIRRVPVQHKRRVPAAWRRRAVRALRR